MATHQSDHNNNASNSDDEEEDFGPVLPGMQLYAPPTQASPTTFLDNGNHNDVPPVKRRRNEEQADEGSATHPAASLPPSSSSEPFSTLTSEQMTTAPDTTIVGVNAETEWKEAWERYTRQHLPRAALYERSFQHTSLQDTYDALSAKADGAELPAAAVQASPVHDVCVHCDALGALIATIDAAGVVRVWRKLPRGVFFITELDKVFSKARKAASSHKDHHLQAGRGEVEEGREETLGARRHHRTYWAHAYPTLQLLVFVCVEEETIEAGDLLHGIDTNEVSTLRPSSTSPRTVRVHLRQVNPVTFTVEERHTFAFQAPVQPMAMLHITAAMRDSTLPCGLAYTRRPAFLTYQYAPHIAFFVSLPAAASARGSSGGSGVVMCPCFPTSQAAKRSASSGNVDGGTAVVMYAAARVSAASPVVQCVQLTSGIERTGTAPCVLIDASGVIDYCTIEAATDNSGGGASASSGLCLKVMAGLAAVPAASREARVWRQWIRFDRRQRTGFFSLVRDAQQALKQQPQQQEEKATATSCTVAPSPADVQLLPGALQLTPDGKYVVVWSIRLMRKEITAVAARHSRIPPTQRSYHVTAESCLHILEFSTGGCVGKHFEALENDTAAVTSVEDISFRASEWADYVHLRSRSLAMQIHVEDGAGASSAKARYYVMVPEVSCTQLLSGRSCIPLPSGDADVGPTRVCGRPIYVYEVTMQEGYSASTAVAAVVRRLSHSPGELESLVRQGSDLAWKGGLEQDEAAMPWSPPTAFHFSLTSFAGEIQRLETQRDLHRSGSTAGEAPHALCRAPLLLLRRAVAPSQDLKNLIAASPLGAALGAEGRKQLLAANTTTATVEGLLLTTSVEAGTTSLLVYSGEVPGSGLAVQRFLTAPARAPITLASEANTRELPHEKGEASAEQQQQRQQLWAKLCEELHRERDYACGALLMATVSPPPGNTAAAGGAATACVPPPISTNDATESEHKEEGVEPASTAANHVQPGSPEAHVVELLKDVVPQLSTAATTKLPVALVHVRGYGTVRVHLLPHIAPLASENFVRLSRQRKYDRLTFHRVIPNAIVQGGCPRGDGTGGESAFDGGAPFQDEALHVFPFFSHTMEKDCCWLCMANAGPNTNASQFFFTVPGGEAMPWLNGHHTVFGFAVEGLDVVRAISLAARDEADAPLSSIIIERVDVLSG